MISSWRAGVKDVSCKARAATNDDTNRTFSIHIHVSSIDYHTRRTGPFIDAHVRNEPRTIDARAHVDRKLKARIRDMFTWCNVVRNEASTLNFAAFAPGKPKLWSLHASRLTQHLLEDQSRSEKQLVRPKNARNSAHFDRNSFFRHALNPATRCSPLPSHVQQCLTGPVLNAEESHPGQKRARTKQCAGLAVLVYRLVCQPVTLESWVRFPDAAIWTTDHPTRNRVVSLFA